jgi:CspA family cold shock protein
MQGTVTWFSNEKGYGFCKDSETGKEYFCHFSAIQIKGYKSLKPEQKISFSIEQGPHGTQCADVKPLED